MNIVTLKPDKDRRQRRGRVTPKELHRRRSQHAQAIDESLRAKTAPSASAWAKDPSRSDIPGVDTPTGSKKSHVSSGKTLGQKKSKSAAVKKPRVKRLSAKQKEAIARREADEKRYRFDDSVTYLTNYTQLGPDEFVVVKTVETSIDKMTRYDEPRTLVMRTRDSRLYQIGTDELTRKGVPAQVGQKFDVRRRIVGDDRQKLHLIVTKIEK